MKYSKPKRIFIVFIIVFLAIFNYIDRAILVPNSDYILMDLLGISKVDAMERTVLINGLHTAFKWTAAGFTILYGYLNDKMSRKKVLFYGCMAYGAFSLLNVIVGAYWHLVILQICTAVAIGASLPTSYSILSDMYPQKNRGRIFGIFGISTVLGDILGNLMISVVFPASESDPASWRWPFLLVGIITIALAVVIMFVVDEPKRGAMESHLSKVLDEESITYSYKIQKEDLVKVWENKSNRWLILNFVDNITGGYMLATAIPWLKEHGADATVAGILILIPALAILCGTLFFGWLGDKLFKRNKKGRVLTCIICVVVSFSILPIAASRQFDLTGLDLGDALTSPQFLGTIILFMLFFFFNNGIGPHWHATIIDVNPVEQRGSMMSIAIFFEELGEGLGILVGAIIHDALFATFGVSMPYSFTWGLLTIALIGGFIFWIPLYKNVDKDIARVEELNKRRARKLKEELAKKKGNIPEDMETTADGAASPVNG